MAPLFSHAYLGGAVLGAVSAAAAYFYHSQIAPPLSFLGPVGEAAIKALTAVNCGFLLTMTATMVQRYIASPLEKISALDLAFMLRFRNFRDWLRGTPNAKDVLNELRDSGVNDAWDNPEYIACYKPAAGKYQQVARGHNQFTLFVLREFIGFKDPVKRQFLPGKYFHDLLKGKKSVTDFVAKFTDRLALIKREDLALEECLSTLKSLAAGYLRPKSAGAARLGQYISHLEQGRCIADDIVQARVWSRNPWLDLTHQEEFFSSASLRGVKWMGRGLKGRIGTFGYLRNCSISALDFTSQKGRIVRARMAAVFCKDRNGRDRAVLFIDGVEGSNAINPKLIKQAIEDYARACGFCAVAYNLFVHNQIPRRFVRCVAEGGVPARTLKIRYADSSTREYLDAFALPLEPFEYAYPRGTVVAYLNELLSDVQLEARPPSLLRRALHSIKRNALWLLVAQTTCYSALITGATTPELVPPLLALAGIGVAAHCWYQRRPTKR